MRGMALMGGMAGDPVKATVDGLPNELSALMTAQASLFMPASQWPASARWWPAQLGEPSFDRHAGIEPLRLFRANPAAGGGTQAAGSRSTTPPVSTSRGWPPQGADGDALTFASNRGPVLLDAFPHDYGMTRRPGQRPTQRRPPQGPAPPPPRQRPFRRPPQRTQAPRS